MPYRFQWSDPVFEASSRRLDEVLVEGDRTKLVMLLAACQARAEQIRARIAELDNGHRQPDAPLTLREAATRLGCSIDFVRRLAADGRLKTYRLGRVIRTTVGAVETARRILS